MIIPGPTSNVIQTLAFELVEFTQCKLNVAQRHVLDCVLFKLRRPMGITLAPQFDHLCEEQHMSFKT